MTLQPIALHIAAESAPTNFKRTRWSLPRPNAALMWLMGVVNRWFFLCGLPVLRLIPFVRDLPLVHGYFWIRAIDLPAADRRAFENAVNRGTVAFMGPNHPEFGTDWLIDKELSTLVAPRMASWADRGIVSAAPGFWGMNNLVANDGGEAAKDYSVAWAMKGEGVLLHPEGQVRWTNDRVHALFPGIAQMAMKAAARSDKPVYVVPLVWKYRFVGDVSGRMHREMRIIESGLGLARMDGALIADRFHALQTNLLAMRMSHFGCEPQVARGDFFAQQHAFQLELLGRFEQRYPADGMEHVDRRIARITRLISAELRALKGDHSATATARRAELNLEMEMANEVKRLGEFSREVYGTPTLSQEQLFESLKRTRDRLLRGGWRNLLAIMLPRPFGPRVAHVGVPEAIRVVATPRGVEYEAGLLELTRLRMQDKLDEINARIAPEVARFAHVNPFV
ncbi:MAG: hypothetical protein ABJE10_03075 [bacterium]